MGTRQLYVYSTITLLNNLNRDLIMRFLNSLPDRKMLEILTSKRVLRRRDMTILRIKRLNNFGVRHSKHLFRSRTILNIHSLRTTIISTRMSLLTLNILSNGERTMKVRQSKIYTTELSISFRHTNTIFSLRAPRATSRLRLTNSHAKRHFTCQIIKVLVLATTRRANANRDRYNNYQVLRRYTTKGYVERDLFLHFLPMY